MLTMARSVTYQIRIDEDEKQKTFEVFNELGVTPAQAVKMFFSQVRRTHSIPFPIDYTPNEKSAKLLLESNDYSKSFNTLDDLFSDLEI